jgi:hypothetical protein
VPVGVPIPEVGETTAVKVIDCPNTLGLADDVTVVVVGVCACAPLKDTSSIALATSATLPIARDLFRGARDARNTCVPSAHAKSIAPHAACQTVFT